jgi:hypothetical protein
MGVSDRRDGAEGVVNYMSRKDWTFVELIDHTLKNGLPTKLSRWTRPCDECGAPIYTTAPAWVLTTPVDKVDGMSGAFRGRYCEKHRLTRKEALERAHAAWKAKARE